MGGKLTGTEFLELIDSFTTRNWITGTLHSNSSKAHKQPSLV
jgi:hypothetical protein